MEKYFNQINIRFIRLLFKLALPIALQTFLGSSMALVDTLMIGQLNEAAIAAVGIANQFVFIFMVLQFGIHGGVAIFTAQYWGRGDLVNVKKLSGIGLMTGLALGAVFTFATMVIPDAMIELFSKDTRVIGLGSEYLWIVGFSFGISVFTFSYMNNLRSMEIVKAPMYASLIAVVLNVALNYMLIFGKMGFPAMGVNGAAIATCISKFIEGFALMAMVHWKKYPIAASIAEMLDFDAAFAKRVLKTCWPVFLNELVWVSGVSIYNIVYARIGTESIAAVNIVVSIENFILIPFFGMFYAGSTIIGNSIGAGRPKDAYLYGKFLLAIQFSMGILAGGLMILSRDTILSFYNLSEGAYRNAYHLMFVSGIILCVKITNFTNIVSVLRGGGDTRFGFFLDLTGVWCIGIPIAFFAAFYFHLPVYWVMALVVTEEIYKLGLGIPRFFSRKWIKNLADQT
ncbi:MAG: MATE family efflux transporter [Proteobacteria bacterium]|nr:MATE family efflux transporter [Desulfobacula sp.]MBU4133601.1 MATE family efflux transporter [Pseudomonadota bacterium]